MRPETKVQSITRATAIKIDGLLFDKYIDRDLRKTVAKDCLMTALWAIIDNALTIDEIKEMTSELQKM